MGGIFGVFGELSGSFWGLQTVKKGTQIVIPYQEGSWRGFGRHFRRFWRAFGRSLVPLGGLLAGLWGHVAAMLASLGTVLGALGAAGRHF